MNTLTLSRATVVPSLRYRDAPAAIDWLCDVIGFSRHAVYPGEGGTIMHAQLVLGAGMIMLGSALDTPFGRLVKTPAETGGFSTGGLYVLVPDADAVFARAKAKGAKIEMDIVDQDYGGRGFTCRDPEGYVWSVGTYDPWAEAGAEG
jgi:uncharacterized glyoxalase superfamily protein PhnB